MLRIFRQSPRRIAGALQISTLGKGATAGVCIALREGTIISAAVEPYLRPQFFEEREFSDKFDTLTSLVKSAKCRLPDVREFWADPERFTGPPSMTMPYVLSQIPYYRKGFGLLWLSQSTMAPGYDKPVEREVVGQ